MVPQTDPPQADLKPLDKALAALTPETADVIDKARAFVVTDDASLQLCIAFGSQCKELERRIKRTMDPICDSAHQTHKLATAARREILSPVQQARKISNGTAEAFLQEIEDRRRAVEEQRQREERLALRKEEEALEAAAAAEKSGDDEAAEQLVETGIEIAETVREAAPELPAQPILRGGTHTRQSWDFEVENISKLRSAFVLADNMAIGRTVRALDKKMSVDAAQTAIDAAVGAGAVRIKRKSSIVNR